MSGGRGGRTGGEDSVFPGSWVHEKHPFFFGPGGGEGAVNNLGSTSQLINGTGNRRPTICGSNEC